MPTLSDISPPYNPQKRVPPATKAIDKPPVTGMAAKAIPILIPVPRFTAPETTLFTKLRLQVSSNQPRLLNVFTTSAAFPYSPDPITRPLAIPNERLNDIVCLYNAVISIPEIALEKSRLHGSFSN